MTFSLNWFDVPSMQTTRFLPEGGDKHEHWGSIVFLGICDRCDGLWSTLLIVEVGGFDGLCPSSDESDGVETE